MEWMEISTIKLCYPSLATRFVGDSPCQIHPCDFRWFPSDKVELQEAQHLDVILYSREQILKEHDALPDGETAEEEALGPWGIISIKPQVRTLPSGCEGRQFSCHHHMNVKPPHGRQAT